MERREAGLKYRIVRGCGQQHADAPHPLGCCACGKRRANRRRSEKADEFPSPHVRPYALDKASYRLKRVL